MQSAQRTDNDLDPSPINPAWIRSGTPEARVSQWGASSDGLTSTYVWSCTAGTFDWTFDCDEIVHLVDGSVTVTSPLGESRTLAAGDSAFFPAGTTWLWHVPVYVRKHAVLVTPLPGPVRRSVTAVRLSRRAARRVGLDRRGARLAAGGVAVTGAVGLLTSDLSAVGAALGF